MISEEVALSPAGLIAEPQVATKNPQDSNSIEEKRKITDDDEEEEDLNEEEEEDREKEKEEEVASSAHLEPSTLPWPGDKDRRPHVDNDDGIWSEERVSEPEERDTGISGGSQDLSEDQSQAESDKKNKTKWRESMPEGDRWRDDMEVQQEEKGDGSLADDEDEEEEEEEEESHWFKEKAALGINPHVTIVHPTRKEPPEESRLFIEKDDTKEPQVEPNSTVYPEWIEEDDECYLCEHLCSEKLKVALTIVAAGILFPLLVWLGYAFLPFDPPLLQSAPLRVVYTLRCSFFATIPILLGVLVLGVGRLRYSAIHPLYENNLVNKEVVVHWHYINESLALFLFFFMQLAVMATYISHDLVKLVPLLTIIFAFGRLIYWVCLSLGSSIRGLGFGLSFLPILVMLGVNLYYICSSVGENSVFDVAQPTAAPPRQRWWG